MTLKRPDVKLVPVSGSGPGGRVRLGDIQAKLHEIQGDVDQTVERNKPVVTYAAVGGAVALVSAGVPARPQARPAQVDLGGNPPPVSRLVEKAVRFGMRRGFERGLLDGNRAWVVLGGAALLAHLAGRALARRPETVFSDRLEPGDAIQIVHDSNS